MINDDERVVFDLERVVDDDERVVFDLKKMSSLEGCFRIQFRSYQYKFVININYIIICYKFYVI
jgi:hypothetical protein